MNWKRLFKIYILMIVPCLVWTAPSYSIRKLALPDWPEHRKIYDIQQDQLGLLWLATNEGLYRFDGEEIVGYHHEPFDQTALRSDHVHDLFVNHNSRLLLGTTHGLHRYLKSSNAFEVYDFGENLNVLTMTEDLHDYLWIWSDQGLFWLYHEPGTDYYWGQSSLPSSLSAAGIKVSSMFITPQDEMWMATNKGLWVLSLRDRCEVEVLYRDENYNDTSSYGQIQTIGRDIRARTWLGTSKMTLTVDQDRKTVEVVDADSSQSGVSCQSLILSSSGKLFLAAGTMIYTLEEQHSEHLERLPVNHGYQWPRNDISFIMEDRLKPQNLYALVGDHSLYYFERAEVRTMATQLLHPSSINPPKLTKGKILIQESTDSLKVYHNLQAFRFSMDTTLSLDEVLDVTFMDGNSLVLSQNKVFIQRKDENVTLHWPVDVSCVEWFDTKIFLGTDDQGIQILDDATFETVETWSHNVLNSNGLPSNRIKDMTTDSSNHLWIATDEGLVHHDPSANEFVTYRQGSGLPSNDVLSVTIDSAHQVWALTSGGLALFQANEKRFHTLKGVNSDELNAHSLAFVDQSLVLSTSDGLINVFVDSIQFQRDILPVRFSRLFDASGKKYYLLHRSPDIRIDVPYKHNSLLVEFVTIQPSGSLKYSYEYNLHGATKESGDLYGTKNLNLNSLAAGEYNLAVRAFDDRGQLCGQDQIKFAVAPPFWLTPWFFLLITLGAASLIVAYVLIIRDQKRKREAAILDIRKETAADFHDELGSRLTVISLYGNMIREQKGTATTDSTDYLDKVLEQANELYYAMKDVIWSMKPEAETLGGLAGHLVDLGNRLFETSEIDFSSNLNLSDADDLGLSKEVSKNLSLIFREAMHNALRHSQSSECHLEVKWNNNELHIELKDDGLGFDDSAIKGEGLQNMKLRAQNIGGSLNIITSSDGTTVSFSWIQHI